MRKFYLLGLAMLGVIAFGAIAAMSASAAVTFLLAEWLLNGVGVENVVKTTSAGTLALTDKSTPFGAITVLCTASLDGTVEKNGLDTITELLPESTIKCSGNLLCPEPLVTAINLPWKTELLLMEENNEVFYADLILNSGAGEPGWRTDCMNGTEPDTCTGEGINEIMNGTSTIALFSDAFAELAGVNLATCTLGGVGSGEVNGEGLIEDVEGGELAASSV